MTLNLTALFLTILVSVSSCTDNQPQELAGNKASTKNNVLNCYRYTHNNDTVTLKTVLANSVVTGTLIYDFFQKDKSWGTIQGQMKDRLLIADYTFMSEGIQSVRQIVFKLDGNTFIEGYGETENTDQKTTFKNIDSLDFNHSIVLSKIACEE